MRMETPRALPIPACPSSPTACRILPDRWPAFLPVSIGLPRNAPDSDWLVSVPGDCPFLPKDLVKRLHDTRVASHVPLACARSGEWRHPVVGLWPVKLREDLRHALIDENLHKIELWTARHGIAIAEWPATPFDPFFNVNMPDDAAQAEAIAQQYPDA